MHRTWGALPPSSALEWLADLVDIHDRGLIEPIPLPPKTSLAYAEAASRRRDDDLDHGHGGPDLEAPLRAARSTWETDRNRADPFPGEHTDPAFVRVLGGVVGLDPLLGGSRPDETWNSEPTRLGRFAVRVWEPEIANGRRV